MQLLEVATTVVPRKNGSNLFQWRVRSAGSSFCEKQFPIDFYGKLCNLLKVAAKNFHV